MLNLDKIQKIDINNIDVKEVQKLLIANQKMVVIVLMALSLAFVWKMYGESNQKQKLLRNKITQEQAKLSVIQARQDAINQLADYKASIPKPLNVFDVITLISTDAKQSHTSIVSYTPSQTHDLGTYSVIDVNFTVASDDFKSMMLFLRKIEKSKFPVVVNSWSGQEGDDGKISFTMAIRAVLIHP